MLTIYLSSLKCPQATFCTSQLHLLQYWFSMNRALLFFSTVYTTDLVCWEESVREREREREREKEKEKEKEREGERGREGERLWAAMLYIYDKDDCRQIAIASTYLL